MVQLHRVRDPGHTEYPGGVFVIEADFGTRTGAIMSSGTLYYDINVTRQARVADPADLVEPVEKLVRALQPEDPALALRGRSPAHQMLTILEGDTSLVPNFLMTSDIQWNFGRQPEDPTHEIIFSNDFKDERGVWLKVAFSVENPEDGIETTGPGLVAELVLGSVAAGADETARAAHLDRLLAPMTEAFAADDGRVTPREAEE